MWLSLISALLQLTRLVVSYVQQRQLMEAAQAAVLAEQLDASIKTLERMDKARADAVSKHRADKLRADTDDTTGDRPKDPYRRD